MTSPQHHIIPGPTKKACEDFARGENYPKMAAREPEDDYFEVAGSFQPLDNLTDDDKRSEYQSSDDDAGVLWEFEERSPICSLTDKFEKMREELNVKTAKSLSKAPAKDSRNRRQGHRNSTPSQTLPKKKPKQDEGSDGGSGGASASSAF